MASRIQDGRSGEKLTFYIAPAKETIFRNNQIDTFDKAWSYKADWFEAPNERRGGWSGVGRLGLHAEDGSEYGVFMKRQENHQRHTWRHPLAGEPTFACEFRMMQYLHKHNVPAPRPLLFGWRHEGANSQAVLVTEELQGFRPLEDVTEEMFAGGSRPALSEQNRVIRGVAATVRKLHDARIQHRSLYPKHLFVRKGEAGDPEVVVIDLEKSRIKLLPVVRAYYDLSTLNRHARYWSRSRRLYFFKQYLGVERLSAWQKFLFKKIGLRSMRRKSSHQ